MADCSDTAALLGGRCAGETPKTVFYVNPRTVHLAEEAAKQARERSKLKVDFTKSADQSSSRLLDFPPEIRNVIYELVSADTTITQGLAKPPGFHLGLQADLHRLHRNAIYQRNLPLRKEAMFGSLDAGRRDEEARAGGQGQHGRTVAPTVSPCIATPAALDALCMRERCIEA